MWWKKLENSFHGVTISVFKGAERYCDPLNKMLGGPRPLWPPYFLRHCNETKWNESKTNFPRQSSHSFIARLCGVVDEFPPRLVWPHVIMLSNFAWPSLDIYKHSSVFLCYRVVWNFGEFHFMDCRFFEFRGNKFSQIWISDFTRIGGSILPLVRPDGMVSLSGKCDPKADLASTGAGESVQDIRLTTSIPRVFLVGAFSTCVESSFWCLQ